LNHKPCFKETNRNNITMAHLQKGNSQFPFWGSSLKLIRGLDPLGLQTTSEAIYANLLPGISNLTNRLRYYGFYCWLIDFYQKKEKKGNSKEQYNFIRRAELLIAIIMQSENNEILQITGSSFAASLINNTTENFYDLAIGAAQKTANETVYWKYPSGAFGQYYFSPMNTLSLILMASNTDGDTIFTVSKPTRVHSVSGQELAAAFESKIPNNVKEIFYNCITSGKLFKEHIAILYTYFAIEKISPDSEEWKLYVSMLLDKDEPTQENEELFTFHRKETIRQLINFAIDNDNLFNWKTFLLKAYNQKLDPQNINENITQIAWYSYKLNEYYQFACGSVFFATSQYLQSLQSDQYLPQFVKDLASLIVVDLSSSYNITPEQNIVSLLKNSSILESEESLVNQIESLKPNEYIKFASYGITLFFKLYIENIHFLKSLRDFIIQNNTIRDGNMVDGLLFLNEMQNFTVLSFIEHFILNKIIYRHQKVAIRKMGDTNQSTHKFIIENQYIRHIDSFPPRFTSLRLNTLFNLLSDLSVVNSDSTLTPMHNMLILNK